MTLLELAAKVEAAEGPDRELDGLIFRAVSPDGDWHDFDDVWYRRDEDDHVAWEAPPAYTSSLDDALTLVPEGWWLAGLNFNHPDFRSLQDREWHAEVAGPVSWVEYDGFPEPQFNCEGGNAATPALALTAAAIRARSENPA